MGPTPGAGWTPPRCPDGSENSPDYYLYHFRQVLFKELCSKVHSWACPCRGPTPGAGWMPPRCSGGSGNSPDYYLHHFQQVLLTEFCSKMHSWACPCRGPTPGAGCTPPRCPGGSEILQIATYIISIKFCICSSILSHNVTPRGPLKKSYSKL